MSERRTIRTEDGVEVGEGDRAFDYYSMEAGVIGRMDDQAREDSYHHAEMQGSTTPWFVFHHDDGGQLSLNGQRICSLEAAKRKGWLS